jgi:protocatechuate 3,4-dioxygenase alpha subunit
MTALIPTASQTVGPFFEIGLTQLRREQTGRAQPGESVVRIRGRVVDGAGAPVSDVVIEIWPSKSEGDFGRVYPNESGEFSFSTVQPGRVAGPNGALQAPHLAVMLLMRGLLKPLVTRMYFPDDEANDTDPVLALVKRERRSTLIARATDDVGSFHWDVVLQGADETVFFEW